MSGINVTRSSMPPFEEYAEEIKDLWDTHWLTNMGKKHNRLREELCKYLSVKNVSLFANGHLALEAAIASMKLTGEVITTPFTFASTAQAIVRNGLTPVFCDINDEDYTIDVSKAEKLISGRTSAIIPVHVYGSVCDVDGLEKLAKKYNLKLIYDAAHAFGVRIGGSGIGAFGDASMFSFHATKVFNTIEGGCVAYSDNSLTDRLHMIKNFGMDKNGHYPEIGGNAKMNEFQAAMGICNLRHIDDEIEKRRRVAARYTERLSGVNGIKIWREQSGVTHNYAYFPVVFDKAEFGKSRDEAAAALAEHNIFARKYFFPPVNELECYGGRFEAQKTPIAKRISESVLALPIYAGLSIDDADMICDILLGQLL
ncbi:MAG TPA: DegT/DnrJ/EryC1/StrS family aminotransferase [Candidatus Ornithomonoglobus intestinigallinarum]|uniref:DegT/DnrJ/EryC1/StrS family aminotransferase n=1 Tax=Candidatus Ornithomonoglobus intestinigallinarum TaxID=2840894 RepID=A0A9D1H2I4_9FIRM|nr:DegT/DnrJ/EryC1/StrS family aminotransferase [Candidatus Ornithomonoglobus intestinigallinarum]